MKRISELIGAAILGGLAVAAVAFGVSRVSAQEAAAPQQPAAQAAEVEVMAFGSTANMGMMQVAGIPSLDETAAGWGGCAGMNLDPEFVESLRTASQTALAGALGMTVEELEAAREAGQNVREIAEEKGIDLETVQAAVDAARQTVIEQGVADGVITQEQADFLLEHPRGGGGMGPGNGPMMNIDPEVHERIRTAVQAAVAEALGITVEELQAAHEAGTNLVELAEEAGVDIETVREAADAARDAAIDQAVTDGLLTADEAALLKTMPMHRGPGGGHRGGPGGMGPGGMGPGMGGGMMGGYGQGGNQNP